MKKLIFILLAIILFPTFVFALNRVDINNASLTQLDEIVGIGPAMAQRIIDARPFSSINDLDRVKGIGPATLQKINDQGIACINCQTEIVEKSQEIQMITEPVPSPTPTAIKYPSGIFINELLPNSAGADDTNEWIELYNSNNIDTDLSGWQIQDTNGTPKTFTIPNGTNIIASGFLIFKRPDTKIMLNNETDGLNLLTPDKKIADSINYTKAPLGQSYSKTSTDGWAFSTTLTPKAQNIITGVKTTAKTLSKIKNSVNNDLSTKGLADISQSLKTNQNTQKNNPWFLFYIVLSITIALATIILFIKLRLGKEKA
jgi:competence ComEA-like helix-hairpin-helix protein